MGTRLEKAGDWAGQPLMTALAKSRDVGERNAGKRLVQLVDAQLSKLSRDEAFNMLDVMEGRAEPMNDKVATAADVARGLTDELAQEAQDLDMLVKTGNTRVPFQAMANYFPHMIRGVDALKGGQLRKDVLANMERTGAARSEPAAARMLNEYVAWIESGARGERMLGYMVESGQARDEDDAFKSSSVCGRRFTRTGISSLRAR